MVNLRVFLWAVIALTLLGDLNLVGASQAVPFRLSRGYLIIVEGSVDSRKGVSILIDTGSTTTLISKRLAEEIGGQSLGTTPVLVHSLTATIQLPRTILDRVRIGTTEFRRIPAVITSLSSRLPTIGGQCDVVLGMNALARNHFSIDYKNRELRFKKYRPDGSKPRYYVSNPRLAVRLSVRGNPVKLLLDTGSKSLILFKGDPRSYPVRETFRISVLCHLARTEVVRQVYLPDVRLGEMILGTVRALLLLSPRAARTDFDGILGPTALEVRRIDYDLSDIRLTIDPN